MWSSVAFWTLREIRLFCWSETFGDSHFSFKFQFRFPARRPHDQTSSGTKPKTKNLLTREKCRSLFLSRQSWWRWQRWCCRTCRSRRRPRQTVCKTCDVATPTILLSSTTYENSCEGESAHADADGLKAITLVDPLEGLWGFLFSAVGWNRLLVLMMVRTKMNVNVRSLRLRSHPGMTRMTTPTSIPWSSPLFPPHIQSCSSPGIKPKLAFLKIWISGFEKY